MEATTTNTEDPSLDWLNLLDELWLEIIYTSSTIVIQKLQLVCKRLNTLISKSWMLIYMDRVLTRKLFKLTDIPSFIQPISRGTELVFRNVDPLIYKMGMYYGLRICPLHLQVLKRGCEERIIPRHLVGYPIKLFFPDIGGGLRNLEFTFIIYDVELGCGSSNYISVKRLAQELFISDTKVKVKGYIWKSGSSTCYLEFDVVFAYNPFIRRYCRYVNLEQRFDQEGDILSDQREHFFTDAVCKWFNNESAKEDAIWNTAISAANCHFTLAATEIFNSNQTQQPTNCNYDYKLSKPFDTVDGVPICKYDSGQDTLFESHQFEEIEAHFKTFGYVVIKDAIEATHRANILRGIREHATYVFESRLHLTLEKDDFTPIGKSVSNTGRFLHWIQSTTYTNIEEAIKNSCQDLLISNTLILEDDLYAAKNEEKVLKMFRRVFKANSTDDINIGKLSVRTYHTCQENGVLSFASNLTMPLDGEPSVARGTIVLNDTSPKYGGLCLIPKSHRETPERRTQMIKDKTNVVFINAPENAIILFDDRIVRCQYTVDSSETNPFGMITRVDVQLACSIGADIVSADII